jgi:hypothetical protein
MRAALILELVIKEQVTKPVTVGPLVLIVSMLREVLVLVLLPLLL